MTIATQKCVVKRIEWVNFRSINRKTNVFVKHAKNRKSKAKIFGRKTKTKPPGKHGENPQKPNQQRNLLIEIEKENNKRSNHEIKRKQGTNQQRNLLTEIEKKNNKQNVTYGGAGNHRTKGEGERPGKTSKIS